MGIEEFSLQFGKFWIDIVFSVDKIQTELHKKISVTACQVFSVVNPTQKLQCAGVNDCTGIICYL